MAGANVREYKLIRLPVGAELWAAAAGFEQMFRGLFGHLHVPPDQFSKAIP